MMQTNIGRYEIIIGDCLDSLKTLPERSIDIIVTSPPYNLGKAYNNYKDKLPRDQYLGWMRDVGVELSRVLKEDGSFFLNVGSTNIDPWLSFDVASMFRSSFTLQNHIVWTKSISILEETHGHFKPITSKRFLNQNHEAIFQFTLEGDVPVDRLAIGVPYMDKSNIKRRGHAQDKRCAGNTWFIPYETVQSKEDKFNHPACVDEETECLTVNGWKKVDEILESDIVAQFDLTTEKLKWGPISGIHQSTVSNHPMVNVETMYCNMLLTENHRVVNFTRNGCLKIIEASKMRPYNTQIPISGIWENQPNDGIDQPINRDWAELLGWYIAEGYDTKWEWSVEIYQSVSANPKKVERIRTLLNRVGAVFNEAISHREWNGNPSVSVAFQIKGFAATYLRQMAPNKNILKNCLTWKKSFLWALFRGLIQGDGNIRQGDDKRLSFSQKNKHTSDFMQAIGFRLGYSVTNSIRNERFGIHSLSFGKKRKVGIRGPNGKNCGELTKVFYTGKIWCLSTPSTTWVARRNGKIFITGNSFPVELPVRCIQMTGKQEAVVLDPFMGTGTTLVAAHKLGHKCIGMDIDQGYAETAVRRLIAEIQRELPDA